MLLPEAENAGDHLLDLIGGDQPVAFGLPRRLFVPWAPQKIVVVEAMRRVVPQLLLVQ